MKGWYYIITNDFNAMMQGRTGSNGELFASSQIIGAYLCPKRYQDIFTEFLFHSFVSSELDTEEVRLLTSGELTLNLMTGSII